MSMNYIKLHLCMQRTKFWVEYWKWKQKYKEKTCTMKSFTIVFLV